jgi:peptidoglycan/xylan/chitin deacetylase (PgdA/CDA1 family)
VGRRPLELGNSTPMVSIAFDDFPRTALTAGAQILEEAGAKATFYTALGLMGSDNILGPQFVKEDLYHLVERGHELASHTFDHVSARDVSNYEFLENVQRGYDALEADLRLQPSRNFAYPFGCTNLRLKVRVGSRMESCRGNFPGINGPAADLSLLKGNPLYGGIETLPWARDLVDRTVRANGWVIFYTHDVREAPSKFGCTPQLLRELVAEAKKKGCRIMTVADVIQGDGRSNGTGD